MKEYTQVRVTKKTHTLLHKLATKNKRSMLKQFELLVEKASDGRVPHDAK